MRASGGYRTMWVALVALVFMGGVAQAQEDIFSRLPENGFAVVVFRNGVSFDKKFERLAMQIMPMQPGNPQLQLVAQMLDNKADLDAAQLKADTPVAAVAMLQADMKEEPHSVLLVQPQDFDAFVKGLAQEEGLYKRDSFQMTHIGKSGDFAVLGEPAAIKAFQAAKLGLALNDTQKTLWDGADVMLMANIKAIVAAGDPEFKKSLAEAREELEAAEKDEDAGTGRLEAKVKVQTMEKLWALAQELEWTAWAATIDTKAVWVQGTTAFKQGGTIDGYLGGHPAIGEKFAPNLPDVQNWAALWMSYNPGTVVKSVNEIFDLINGLLKEVPMDQIPGDFITKALGDARGQIVKLLEQTGGRGAMMAMAPGEGDAMIRAIAVHEVKDVEAYRRQMKAYLAWYQSLYGEMMKMAGAEASEMVKLSMVYTDDAQKVGDLAVDKIETRFEIKGEAAEQMKPMMDQMMKTFYGSTTPTQWIAFKDGFMLMEMGAEPKNIAAMAAALGKEGGLAAQMADIRKHALADANIIAVVSLSSGMDLITATMMSMQGVEMPLAAVAPVSARTVISLGTSPGQLSSKLYVPVQEMQMAVASGMRMVMSMQGMRNIFPGGGGGGGAQPEAREPFEGF